MKKPLVLEGNNVKLEGFSEKFISIEYLNWLKDKEVNKYLIKPNEKISIEEVRKYCEGLIKSKDNYFFAILIRKINKHIGNVRIGPIEWTSNLCQFGMIIGDRNYQRRGFGNEVLQICITFCFDTLKLHKIYLDVIDDNVPAVKLYEKSCFVTEGLFKEHLFLNGRFYDVRRMGLINPSKR